MRSEIDGTLLRSIFKSVYEYEKIIWFERSDGFYRETGTRNKMAFGISSVKGVGIFAWETVSCDSVSELHMTSCGAKDLNQSFGAAQGKINILVAVDEYG